MQKQKHKHKHYLIYQITNLIDGKIYIGKHETDNMDDGYFGSGKYLKRAQAKHGIENFKKEILFELDTLEELNNKEAELVNEEFVKLKNTYNIIIGGSGGWGYVNKTGKNIYDGHDKRCRECFNKAIITHHRMLKEDEEYREKFCKSVSEGMKKHIGEHGSYWTGKKHKEESKRKTGLASSIHQKGKGNSQYGTCWIYDLKLKENKKIKKDDLDEWLNQGWIKGRKVFKFEVWRGSLMKKLGS